MYIAKYLISLIGHSVNVQKKEVINLYKSYIIDSFYLLQNGGTFASIGVNLSNFPRSSQNDSTENIHTSSSVENFQYNVSTEVYDLESIQIGVNASHLQKLPYFAPYVMLCKILLLGCISNVSSAMSPSLRENFMNVVHSDFLPDSSYSPGAMIVLGDNSSTYVTGGLLNQKMILGAVFSRKNDFVYVEMYKGLRTYFNALGVFFTKLSKDNKCVLESLYEYCLGMNLTYFCRDLKVGGVKVYNLIVGFRDFTLQDLYASAMIEVNTNNGIIIVEIIYAESWIVNIRYNPGVNVYYYQSM